MIPCGEMVSRRRRRLKMQKGTKTKRRREMGEKALTFIIEKAYESYL